MFLRALSEASEGRELLVHVSAWHPAPESGLRWGPYGTGIGVNRLCGCVKEARSISTVCDAEIRVHGALQSSDQRLHDFSVCLLAELAEGVFQRRCGLVAIGGQDQRRIGIKGAVIAWRNFWSVDAQPQQASAARFTRQAECDQLQR